MGKLVPLITSAGEPVRDVAEADLPRVGAHVTYRFPPDAVRGPIHNNPAEGVVYAHERDSVFNCWRVHVRFDPPAGKHDGMPIEAVEAFPHDVLREHEETGPA